jgi:hypothetical protein
MWMREVNRNAWQTRDPDDISHRERAKKDLFRDGPELLSFFRPSSCEEIMRVGHLFAITVRRCRRIDFILLDEGRFTNFSFCPDQDAAAKPALADLHPYLRERHFELHGLEQVEVLNSFLSLALAANSIPSFTESELLSVFRALAQNEEIQHFQRERDSWLKRSK